MENRKNYIANPVWFVVLLIWMCSSVHGAGKVEGFMKANGTRFNLNGKPYYVNGFNAYWMTYFSMDLGNRPRVSKFLSDAASLGVTVVRTWAFNDGGFRALQLAPGLLNEEAFQALDFVISEAKKQGMRLILGLSNNYEAFGGRPQYLKWAQQAGLGLNSQDAFFSEEALKSYYRSYVWNVLTRVNSITGVKYMDDPAIFAWELINEARCESDPTGETLHAWIQEMASFIKSIDRNHMLEIGLEGFYGQSNRGKQTPFSWTEQLGTDFIRNNQIPEVDFATVHAYPDLWMPGVGSDAQLAFLTSWMEEHIEDATNKLQKPLLFTEFNKSDREPEYTVQERDRLLETAYSIIYGSAKNGGAAAGGLVWQLFMDDMVDPVWKDSFQIVISRSPSTARVISAQSERMYLLASA